MSLSEFQLVDVHIFCIFVLLTLFIGIMVKKKGFLYSTTAILLMCAVTILILVLDFIPWLFNGKPGAEARRVILVINTIYFMLHTLSPIIWLCYIDLTLYGNIRRLRRRFFYLYPMIISIGLTVFSLKTGFVFYIDEANVYHRGIGNYLITVMDWLILVYALLLTLRNRNKVQHRISILVLTFSFLPLAGSFLNILFTDTSIIFPLSSLSLVLAYFFIEIRNESRDYLTGLFNRQQIDSWTEYRLVNFKKRGVFSLLVIDIDDFKSINDNYGHHMGDKALVSFANILTKSIKLADKAGRYGGDEFVLLIDSGDERVVEQVKQRLSSHLERENELRTAPYRLSFSCGSVVYDPAVFKSRNEIFAAADKMMYEDKRSKQLQHSNIMA